MASRNECVQLPSPPHIISEENEKKTEKNFVFPHCLYFFSLLRVFIKDWEGQGC